MYIRYLFEDGLQALQHLFLVVSQNVQVLLMVFVLPQAQSWPQQYPARCRFRWQSSGPRRSGNGRSVLRIDRLALRTG